MLTAIGVDDQHIWFGLLSDGAYRIDKKGGTPKTLFAGRGQVDAIGQDDANVYFGATRYGTKQRAEIDAVKKDGGAFSVITSDLYDAMGVVAVPGALFVNDNGVVKRFARSGGRSEKVSGVGSVVGLTHRGSEVLFSDIEISNENVAAGVWFAGTPPKLLAEASGAVGIAVDDETVYWADARARKLSALDLPPIP